MNKKIYYSDKYIEFAGPENPRHSAGDTELVSGLGNGGKAIKKIVKKFLDPEDKKNYVFVEQDFERVLNLLKPEFHYIEAAGGFIENGGKYLFIFRHQRWDLPKGKREKGEAIMDCAVRECEEECGISGLHVRRPLASTYHIYPHKGGHALKQTYWFYMSTDFSGPLTPQLDEDITRVEWFDEQQIRRQVFANTYYTIADVTRDALSR